MAGSKSSGRGLPDTQRFLIAGAVLSILLFGSTGCPGGGAESVLGGEQEVTLGGEWIITSDFSGTCNVSYDDYRFARIRQVGNEVYLSWARTFHNFIICGPEEFHGSVSDQIWQYQPGITGAPGQQDCVYTYSQSASGPFTEARFELFMTGSREGTGTECAPPCEYSGLIVGRRCTECWSIACRND